MSPDADSSRVSPVSHTWNSHEIGNAPDIMQDSAITDTQTVQPQRQNPGLGPNWILNHQPSHTFTTESAGSPWNRFEIPTKNDSLSSGFPFHPLLYDLKITHDQWSLFSSDIVKAAKLTPYEDFMSWATGITTGTITSPILLVFAPVLGYFTGRMIHRKAVVKSVKQRLGQEGDIRSVLRRWNRDIFEEKGFHAWLELPIDPQQLQKEDLVIDTPGSPKARKKAVKKAGRRFRIIIIPHDNTATITAELTSGVVPSNIPPLEAPAEPRIPQELNSPASDPPAYTPALTNNTDIQPTDIQRPNYNSIHDTKSML
ncbi:hypothetical protein F5884DRAFT_702202 [Xylogone sp. PMI_703]|nr:hypothetical protein F5884DRAFT_702202 [Xylogone sp. PMI_703]